MEYGIKHRGGIAPAIRPKRLVSSKSPSTVAAGMQIIAAQTFSI
jgi:hypothetical protein